MMSARTKSAENEITHERLTLLGFRDKMYAYVFSDLEDCGWHLRCWEDNHGWRVTLDTNDDIDDVDLDDGESSATFMFPRPKTIDDVETIVRMTRSKIGRA
jgi:hypothetical protein